MATSQSTSDCPDQDNTIFVGLSKQTTNNGENYIFGESETELLEGEEADCNRQLKACRKNPGHTEFIPLNSFTIQHLPTDLQDKLLFNFIKVTAELTVKINSHFVSPKRPEFWYKTNIPYPYYRRRGKALLRVGTGRVWNVWERSGENKDGKRKTCPCQSCQSSDTPSTVWWNLEILTAAHVVFDDTEAKHSTCKLFYDIESSPEVIVQGLGIFDTDVKGDITEFVCVTCDRAVAKRLGDMVDFFEKVWDIVFEKYKSSSDVNNLTFIVSHPHGGPKQVSLGQWVEKHQEGESQDYKFTYTTCTCPGSSGAPAITVGFSWFTQQFHSGSLNNGFNSSTVSSVWKC
ncbi:hypothetical protein BgiBS90_027978 [Biomphalaria glabrata]|nr:hypothetical protein BgiBS90_027978 [Biomphalaria glabrata]